MVKLPRNVSGRKLAKALETLGYRKVSQKGSHMRLVTTEHGSNRVIVTDEHSIPVGTLHSIMKYVADHFGLSIEELFDKLDLR